MTCLHCNTHLKKERREVVLPTKEGLERHTEEVLVCASCGEIYFEAPVPLDLSNLRKQLKGGMTHD